MKQRELLPELMDDPAACPCELEHALKDITIVNKWLGGDKLTLKGLCYFFEAYPKDEYRILDVGCGNGDALRKIAAYCRDKGINAQFIGIDISEKGISLAREQSKQYPEICFYRGDVLEMPEREISCDIALCTLTLHHFAHLQIERFLSLFKSKASLGIVINDLHRSKLAYGLFTFFSSIFMKTRMARHDGLVSIKRGFKKKELETLAKELGVSEYRLSWRWAFRYLWIIDNRA